MTFPSPGERHARALCDYQDRVMDGFFHFMAESSARAARQRFEDDNERMDNEHARITVEGRDVPEADSNRRV